MPELFGDVPLAVILRERLPTYHHRAAAAVVTSESMTLAAMGAPLEADYEIGSVSKGITGLLYADAIARGEVSPTTTVGSLLPLGDSDVGDVTLDALATHRSGLPRLPMTWDLWRRSWHMYRHGTNPFGESLIQLLIEARDAKVRKPKPKYSNIGFELLGHAIAAAAESSYRDLVRDRLAQPLELDPFYVPHFSDELTPLSVHGTSKRGRPHEPWTGEGLGPAGGIRASIGAMAELASAMIEHRAPGMRALDPQLPLMGKSVRIGAAWLTLENKGREVTWHNGRTGGFASWMGVDRAAKTAVVILSATASSVDRYGFSLLHEAVNSRRPSALA